jgi:hypothetical protein
LNLLRRSATKGQMLQCTDGRIYEAMTLQEAKSIARHLGLTLRTKHKKALTMKFVPPDTCLKDYKERRSAFLKELIASTPNVSARAKEFRRWIDENSPFSDNDEA